MDKELSQSIEKLGETLEQVASAFGAASVSKSSRAATGPPAAGPSIPAARAADSVAHAAGVQWLARAWQAFLRDVDQRSLQPPLRCKACRELWDLRSPEDNRQPRLLVARLASPHGVSFARLVADTIFDHNSTATAAGAERPGPAPPAGDEIPGGEDPSGEGPCRAYPDGGEDLAGDPDESGGGDDGPGGEDQDAGSCTAGSRLGTGGGGTRRVLQGPDGPCKGGGDGKDSEEGWEGYVEPDCHFRRLQVKDLVCRVCGTLNEPRMVTPHVPPLSTFANGANGDVPPGTGGNGSALTPPAASAQPVDAVDADAAPGRVIDASQPSLSDGPGLRAAAAELQPDKSAATTDAAAGQASALAPAGKAAGAACETETLEGRVSGGHAGEVVGTGRSWAPAGQLAGADTLLQPMRVGRDGGLAAGPGGLRPECTQVSSDREESDLADGHEAEWERLITAFEP